jgi:hypothetical protein
MQVSLSGKVAIVTGNEQTKLAGFCFRIQINVVYVMVVHAVNIATSASVDKISTRSACRSKCQRSGLALLQRYNAVMLRICSTARCTRRVALQTARDLMAHSVSFSRSGDRRCWAPAAAAHTRPPIGEAHWQPRSRVAARGFAAECRRTAT